MNTTEETQQLLNKTYETAKENMNSGKEERIIAAKEAFLSLGDYKNSAVLAEKCDVLLSFGVGCQVTFGAYNGKPITWRVCDTNGKMRMLIAEDVVLEKPYNDLRVDVYWQTTTLRKWLNKEFIQEAFSKEERMMLIATRRTNEPNEQFLTSAGLPTMDKVFVLSKAELDRYLPAEADRVKEGWWWLRTPGDNLLSVVAVDEKGVPYLHGVNINYQHGGVRPALWMLLK